MIRGKKTPNSLIFNHREYVQFLRRSHIHTHFRSNILTNKRLKNFAQFVFLSSLGKTCIILHKTAFIMMRFDACASKQHAAKIDDGNFRTQFAFFAVPSSFSTARGVKESQRSQRRMQIRIFCSCLVPLKIVKLGQSRRTFILETDFSN